MTELLLIGEEHKLTHPPGLEDHSSVYFFVIDACDGTISTVPTKHNTVNMPFRRNTLLVHM